MVLGSVWFGLAELSRPLWYRIPEGKLLEYEPSYFPLVSEFEHWFRARFDAWWWLATEGGVGTGTLITAAVYLAAIFLGQRAMRGRAAFRFDRALTAWNVLLAAFSIVGTARALPELVDILWTRGWTASACDGRFNVGLVGTWPIMFGLSKYAELGDTAFLVLRKKPVIFLHYVHHVITMVVCGYYSIDMQGNSRWFVTTNLLVHSVMYTYFALRSVNVRTPKWLSMAITGMQLTQMVVGTAVCLESLHRTLSLGRAGCDNTPGMVVTVLGMYLLYFYLFAQFFRKAYFRKPAKRVRGSKVEPLMDNNNNNKINGIAVEKGLPEEPRVGAATVTRKEQLRRRLRSEESRS